MKTTTTQPKFLMYALLMVFAFFMSTPSKSQCTPNFSYTLNANGNVSFQSTSTNTTAGTQYYWNLGNNATSTNQATSTTYTANGIYSISLFIYAIPSCSAGITQTINVTNVPTNTTCTLASNFTYTIGSNGVVHFSSTSIGTSTNTNYYWSFNNNTFAYTPTATCNYANNGFYTVCLFLSDSTNNCTSSHCDTLSITNASPSNTTSPCNASFSYSIGSNGNVSFYNTSTGTTTNTSYSWVFNNSSSASGPNPTATFTNYFNYVCLTISDSASNCYSTVCDSIIIPSNPCSASVNFAMIADSTQALTWWAYANYPQNVTNAVWYWGDNSSSTGLYPSHTYSASSFYNICVSITVSCAGTASYCANTFINRSSSPASMYHVNVIGNTSTSPTGIKTTQPDQFLETRLYPNPAKDKAFLSINTNELNNITVSIYEITGQLMFEKKVQVDNGTNKIELETSGLTKGLYFVNITSGTSKKTIRLIKD